MNQELVCTCLCMSSGHYSFKQLYHFSDPNEEETYESDEGMARWRMSEAEVNKVAERSLNESGIKPGTYTIKMVDTGSQYDKEPNSFIMFENGDSINIKYPRVLESRDMYAFYTGLITTKLGRSFNNSNFTLKDYQTVIERDIKRYVDEVGPSARADTVRQEIRKNILEVARPQLSSLFHQCRERALKLVEDAGCAGCVNADDEVLSNLVDLIQNIRSRHRT